MYICIKENNTLTVIKVIMSRQHAVKSTKYKYVNQLFFHQIFFFEGFLLVNILFSFIQK